MPVFISTLFLIRNHFSFLGRECNIFMSWPCLVPGARKVAEKLLVFRAVQWWIFLPRDALLYSVVLRLHVVRPSVRLSVTLVDQDHKGWNSWKLIARTISPTPSLFVAQRPSSYSQGNMGKYGETRGGVRKSGVLEHKSGNISETRKDRGKVTMESL